MSDYRLERVQHLIRNELSSLILKGEIKDPRVNAYVAISNIEVSKDISFARVYISSLEGDNKIKSVVNALNHAAGFIQFKLGKKMKTRKTPKLQFIADMSVKEGDEINQRIKDLDIDRETL